MTGRTDTCPVCHGPLPGNAEVGRRRKYCSDRCRSRAHRARDRETRCAEARRSGLCQHEVLGYACERPARFLLVVDGNEVRVCAGCRKSVLDFLVSQGSTAATVETKRIGDPPPRPAAPEAAPTSAPRNRVLVIEDDDAMRDLLMTLLNLDGFRASGVADGPSGLDAALAQRPDAVLLDLMLPGMSGIEVLRRLREVSDVPVIVVTAKSDRSDRILGFNSGADDYVVKPFHPKELMARLRGVIHRRGPGGEPERYDDGVLRLDLLAREAQVAGVPLRLTAPEFRLLALLTRSAGTAQPVTRIAVHVWGEADRDDSLVRVRILVTRLRRKLDLTGLGGEVIVSARGQGYFYAPPDRAAPPRATRAEPSPGGYGHASRLLGT